MHCKCPPYLITTVTEGLACSLAGTPCCESPSSTPDYLWLCVVTAFTGIDVPELWMLHEPQGHREGGRDTLPAPLVAPCSRGPAECALAVGRLRLQVNKPAPQRIQLEGDTFGTEVGEAGGEAQGEAHRDLMQSTQMQLINGRGN